MCGLNSPPGAYAIIILWLFLFTGDGPGLVLTDSLGKHLNIKGADVSFHRGCTVGKLNDMISFGSVQVQGYSKILIHVGTNDLAQLISSGEIHSVTVHHVLQFFKRLSHSIARKNARAIQFSAILPRSHNFDLFYNYAYGLNFALEKWCARSKASRIFVPSHKPFLLFGRANPSLLSVSDGLHVRGAGNDTLEAFFQQALSTGNMLKVTNSKHTKKLAKTC